MRQNHFSHLYAQSQGLKITGEQTCYWCGGPCETTHTHNDPAPIPFVRQIKTARKPGSLYQCEGCWHWRLPSRTIRFISIDPETRQHPLADRKTAKQFSWVITPTKALAIRHFAKEDKDSLYHILLNPPPFFSVALRDGEHNIFPHLLVVNDNETVSYDTVLHFTVNDTIYHYCVYELEEGLRTGPTGKMPGVAELIRILGLFDLGEPKTKDRGTTRKEDRPDGKNLKKMVR